MLSFKNKIVVITGGANGIGLSIAKKFLENAAKTAILLDIDKKTGSSVVIELNKKHGENGAKFINCDVTKNLDAADKIIQEYKHVDILVNSAGLGLVNNHKKLIDLNVSATIEWSYKFHDHMRIDKGGKGGTIINLSSIYGFRINRYLSTYQASKFAVMGFTKSLGHIENFQETGVRVVVLCPGYTRTEMTESIKKKLNNNELDKSLMVFVNSMRGLTQQEPDVVGDAAVDIYKTANSGTAWLIEDGGPVKEICNKE